MGEVYLQFVNRVTILIWSEVSIILGMDKSSVEKHLTGLSSIYYLSFFVSNGDYGRKLRMEVMDKTRHTNTLFSESIELGTNKKLFISDFF